jgi:hypothetical protein
VLFLQHLAANSAICSVFCNSQRFPHFVQVAAFGAKGAECALCSRLCGLYRYNVLYPYNPYKLYNSLYFYKILDFLENYKFSKYL